MMKKIFLTIAIFISLLSYSQADIVREGRYHVVSGLDTISSHDAERNAIESMLNQKFAGVTDIRIITPVIRIDLDDSLLKPSQGWNNISLIDTITVDVFKWGISSKPVGYFKSLDCTKLYAMNKDTAQTFETGRYAMTMLRTKDWPLCETTYDYISSEKIIEFSIITQPHVIDGVLNMEANDYCQAWFDMEDENFPQQIKHSDVESSYRWKGHTMRITDWDPGSTYTITGYVVNQNKDTIVSEPIQYTHPDVDVQPLEGFTYYTVWVPEADITSTSAKLRSWTTEQCTIQAIIGTTKFNMVEYPMDNGLNASHPSYWQHGRLIEGLEPDTRYYFELTNVNAAGKLIRSSIHSFKTKP